MWASQGIHPGGVHGGAQHPPPSIPGAEDPADAEGHVVTDPGSPMEGLPQPSSWDRAGCGLTPGYGSLLSLPGAGREVPSRCPAAGQWGQGHLPGDVPMAIPSPMLTFPLSTETHGTKESTTIGQCVWGSWSSHSFQADLRFPKFHAEANRDAILSCFLLLSLSHGNCTKV